MPRLNEAQCSNAIGRIETGESQTAVATTALNVSQSIISRFWDMYRPRVTTAFQDRYIRLRHLRERFTTSSSTASAIPGGLIISYQTVRNRLRDAKIRARRPVKAVVLTQRHQRNRLQWAQTQLSVGDQFGSVMNHDFCYNGPMVELGCIYPP